MLASAVTKAAMPFARNVRGSRANSRTGATRATFSGPMTVVAEGIETLRQAEWLRRAGCTIGQGYLFGMPMPGEQVPDYLGLQEARLCL
jgi:EAL domain-containing protein (putative c-di-GMP-specific phosphodiesterase class I)